MTARTIDPFLKVWDPDVAIGDMLKGKRGLVVGIANEQSIASGCAAKLRAFGAELAVTWLNEKAEARVRPLGERIDASIMMRFDVERPGELEAVTGDTIYIDGVCTTWLEGEPLWKPGRLVARSEGQN